MKYLKDITTQAIVHIMAILNQSHLFILSIYPSWNQMVTVYATELLAKYNLF